jgi:hypothetical protein
MHINRTQQIFTTLAAVACLAAAGCGSSSTSKPAATNAAPAATQAAPSGGGATTDAGSGASSSSGGSASGGAKAIIAKCKAQAGDNPAQFAICMAQSGASLDDPKADACMKSAKSAADVTACLQDAIK